MGWGGLKVTVRRLEAADVASISEIFGWYAVHSMATFEETPRTDSAWHDLRVATASRGLPFLVAEADGAVCGYAYAAQWRGKPAYRHTVEDSVFIAPGLTGHGIGRKLLTELLAAAAAAGARQMVAVIADTGDPASTGLHAACGFRPAGWLTSVGYKHGQWIDTLFMQREL